MALTEAYVKSIRQDKMDQIKLAEEIQQKINRFETDALPIRRELEASDSSYKGLLNRIEEARMSADEETSLITIYEYAAAPMEPAKPRKLIVMLIAFIVGGGAGVGFALLIHTLQDKVSSLLDIEVELKQNLLGVIPHSDNTAETGTTAKISHTDKFSPIAEASAGLRAALLSQGHKPLSGGWAILVTGVAPLDGKTSTSCNLAISMARTGKKILMIDGDMRRPKLHEVFDIRKRKRSMMEVLVEDTPHEALFSETLHDTEIENLKIAVGHPVEGVSPTEVLDTGRFEMFLNWARSRFDIIIIDSPPLGGISDGLVFGRMVDDVVLVCRYNKSRKGVLKHAISDLQKNRCPVLGMVINDFTVERFQGHYGYHYGSYYHHYYSPEDKRRDDKKSEPQGKPA
jgi:capsular exopolysaccharide synthesis family protein